MEIMQEQKVSIELFSSRYSHDFARLNYEWLEKYFEVEDYDRDILSNPKATIIDKGGQILFAMINETVVGTVALIMRGEGVFELSKMAVTEDYKGMRIGQKLMYASIDYAGQHNVKRLFLDSNTSLTPAIRLYQKVGFKEIPVPEDSPYDRCNIRMELFL